MASIQRFLLLFAVVWLSPDCSFGSSLCSRGEATYFSCQIQGSEKTASLCGSRDLVSGNEDAIAAGWLQFRFGTLSRTEIVFPSKKKGSLSAFHGFWSQHKPISDSDTWGFDDSLFFADGATEYSITIARYEADFYGIGIKRNKERVSLECLGLSAEKYGKIGDSNHLFYRLVRALPQIR